MSLHVLISVGLSFALQPEALQPEVATKFEAATNHSAEAAGQSNKLSKDAIVAAREGVLMAIAAYALENRETGKEPSDGASLETEADGILHAMDSTKTYSGSQYGGYGYTGKYQGIMVFGFSGTDFMSISDVMADITSLSSKSVNLGGTSYSAGTGFVNQYTELKQVGLNEAIQHITGTPGTLVRVVGHSLGGSLANLCAVELANLGAKVLLQTAGSPRVFDSQMSESYKRVQTLVAPFSTSSVWTDSVANIPGGRILTQRLANYGDNVPSTPQSTIGYSHVGNGGIYINKPYCWRGCPMACTNEAMDFTPYQGPVSSVNHIASQYLSRLQEAIDA